MLRVLRNPFPQARLRAFQVTTTNSPSIAVDVGDDDLSASSRSAAGKVALTLLHKHARGPVLVGAPGANIANGGFVCYDTDPTGTVVTLEALGAAGAGDDGTFYGLELGWDYDSGSDGLTPQTVRHSGNVDILVAGIVASDGTFESNLGEMLFSVSKTATGVYALTLKHFTASRNILPVAVVPIASAQKSARVTAVSASGFTVSTFSVAEAAEDNKFAFLVAIPRNPYEALGTQKDVLSTGIEPTISGIRVTAAGGTPAIALGLDDTIVADNGTGNYSIGLDSDFDFPGSFVAIPIAKDNRAQLADSPYPGSINIKVFDAAGVAADDDFHLIVIGDMNRESVGL